MIRVHRYNVRTPIQPRFRQYLYSRAEAFFKLPLTERHQRRLEFDPDQHVTQEIKDALLKLFMGKCAYCETRLETDSADLHRHRPTIDTITERREYLPDHYWWLAYHWSNLYIACPTCARAKGSHFPISGARSPIKGKLRDLRDEQPQLLDPCSDKPEIHFIFDNDGMIYPRTWRGKQSIDRLDLNREKLVESRRKSLTEPSALNFFNTPPNFVGAGNDINRGRMEFAGFIRGVRDLSLSNKLQEELERIKAGQISYSEAANAEMRISATQELPYIKSIRVHNVGPIDSLTINLNSDDTYKIPCLAIIGENSVGKSSVLKSVALALTHQRTRSRLRIKPENITDAAAGGIEIEHLSGHHNKLDWDLGRFLPTTLPRDTLILGYGSTRLTSDQAHIRKLAVTWERIGNLFDPYTALTKPERWLTAIDDERFEFAARALRALLSLPENAYFQRNRVSQTVELNAYGRVTRITRLSDGLQSVLGLACDIMTSLFDVWGAPEIAEGVVLLDEIENHLHPRWKMKIVSALRRAFPRMQFLLTTHDPLCLKGMADGEVVVLRRNKDGAVKAVQNLPQISRMRIDQILTSEHFGLSSTLDVQTEELYERYYKILRDTPESSNRTEELCAIMQELDENRLMGNTRRERLMLEAIDRYLSKTPEVQADAEFLDNQLNKKLAAILNGHEKVDYEGE